MYIDRFAGCDELTDLLAYFGRGSRHRSLVLISEEVCSWAIIALA